MPGVYRDVGIALRTVKLGEADRIVTFVTEGHGKVRAVAKGVRKSGSRFGGRLEPTSHIQLQCYRGRELDVVTQVETIDANRALREHYGCLTHSISMLEATDQVAQEREAVSEQQLGVDVDPAFEPEAAPKTRHVVGEDATPELEPDGRSGELCHRRIGKSHTKQQG